MEEKKVIDYLNDEYAEHFSARLSFHMLKRVAKELDGQPEKFLDVLREMNNTEPPKPF